MDLNKETVKKLRGLIVFTVVVLIAGINYHRLLGLFGTVVNMVLPFLLGAAIAFILNVPMRNIEKLFPKKSGRWKRPAALAAAITAVVVVLLTVTVVVIPQLWKTLYSLRTSVPAFFEGLQIWLEKLFADNPEIIAWINTIEVDWQGMVQEVVRFLKNGAGSVLSTTFSAAANIVSGVTSLGIGMVFAIYILLQKETLAAQAKKLLKAFLPEKWENWIIQVAALTEKTFSSFLAGQCVEAGILGSMFFVTLLLLRLPYALLIGVLIAFTALIPVFGAFIGCAVGIFLMLMESPVDALIFTVVFFVLQQIEGNLIYPHVVGNSVGLPSIWVLVAVTIGGSAMGVLGMLVFIPLCSVLYSLLRGLVNHRVENKCQKD